MLKGLTWLAAGLWWGSLTALGFVFVPLLFKFLPTAQLAGTVAAQLFSAQTWLSSACVLVLLLGRPRLASESLRAYWPQLLALLLGLWLALMLEFAVAPRIRAREQLALWHSLGTGMFALQWLCAGFMLGRGVWREHTR